MMRLLLVVSSFTHLFAAQYTFAFFNACPSSVLQFRYGSSPNALVTDDGASGLYPGYSLRKSVSYSPIYYEIVDGNNIVVVSSVLTVTNNNLNAIGWISYPNIGCQHFQYSPTDMTLSSRSVVVFINGAEKDKTALIGTTVQGQVFAQPNT
jgi:hypothetical protein